MYEKYGAPFSDVHRGDLQMALVKRAQGLGVNIVLGQKVVALDTSDSSRARIFTEPVGLSGSRVEHVADLIVGADGLWSRCREFLLGQKDPPLPTGDLAYRIVLTLDQIQDPKLREMVSNPAVHFWIGPGAHVVSYSIRGGTMFNIVLLVPDDLPENVARQKGSVEEMRKLFVGWDPVLTQFLECVDTVDKWRLMHRRELQSWINDQGNLVMIGDSCHPMLPYLAQGANSSIEDGAVLGRVLGHITTRSQLPSALRLFQQLRKKRGEAIVKQTFKQRDWFHMPDGERQEQRDQVFMKYLGREVDCEFPSAWYALIDGPKHCNELTGQYRSCPEVQPWLYGYDAEKEVEAAIAKGGFDVGYESSR